MEGAARAITRKRLGAVRRAQQITTYGVGSMVAIGDQSFLVSGLNTWMVRGEPDVREPRLEGRLQVNGFRLPPASNPPAGDGVRVRRFPTTYSCHECGALGRYRDFNSSKGEGHCGQCDRTVTPSRFIMACANGHLDEFPYWEWVHLRTAFANGGSADRCRMKLRVTGHTASLRSIVIECSCGKKASLEGVFGAKALGLLGITCKGKRPWLSGPDSDGAGCRAIPRALQRGSSAAWFPVVRSALSIPPWHRALMQLVMRHRRHLLGEDEPRIRRYAEREGWLDNGKYTASEVIDAVHTLEASEDDLNADQENPTGLEASDSLRVEEYRQLNLTTEETRENEHFVCVPPAPSERAHVPGIERTMLVKRLREVRALQTFTRVDIPMPSDKKERRAPLHSGGIDWLPAIEVIGEGVFLKLDTDRLTDWEVSKQHTSVAARVDRLRNRHTALLCERGAGDEVSAVSPRLVMIHTLSHALMNEWSLDCGYPAASLRERLYVSNDMAGVLLYTATSDSAGSLGGVIAQGDPHRLAASLDSALRRASWCSADPLCMESDAGGAYSLNMAACHACVLLPETSCELNNTFLDRALLVGDESQGIRGFFHDIM
ncbi:DUF1998 domain-containing protein [Streptomyces sp. NPDC004647]|uniref:DUF1998 domain-containing protein n=1 Tax=Streptomyces sp. NPDC004647 TaxID=3154671 RepID=UPI0033AE710D